MTLAVKRIVFLIALTFIAASAASCTSPAQPVNVDSEGIAIKGFDSVSYFTVGKPLKGDEEFQFEWKGAKWLFSKREHLDLFMAAPEKYAPQYGGY